MKLRLSLLFILFSATACTFDDLSRAAYNIGQDYDCVQTNQSRAYDTNKDLNCTNGQSGTKKVPYDEYKQAREESLAKDE